MKTCPDCGCRVYKLGCVNCNEVAYIEQQIAMTEQREEDRAPSAPPKNTKQEGACSAARQ